MCLFFLLVILLFLLRWLAGRLVLLIYLRHISLPPFVSLYCISLFLLELRLLTFGLLVVLFVHMQFARFLRVVPMRLFSGMLFG